MRQWDVCERDIHYAEHGNSVAVCKTDGEVYYLYVCDDRVDDIDD